MVQFYGEQGDLDSVPGRGIRAIGAADSTLLLALDDGRDLVIWIDENNDLAFRLEADGIN